MRGAGGTNGGIGQFFIGFFMICGGGYLFLSAIRVQTYFGFSQAMYRVGGFGLTGGMILIPFIIGIGIVFYNARNVFGWLLAAGSLAAMSFGVISNISLSIRTMSAFELVCILVLLVGGIGLFLNSLRNFDKTIL